MEEEEVVAVGVVVVDVSLSLRCSGLPRTAMGVGGGNTHVTEDCILGGTPVSYSFISA